MMLCLIQMNFFIKLVKIHKLTWYGDLCPLVLADKTGKPTNAFLWPTLTENDRNPAHSSELTRSRTVRSPRRRERRWPRRGPGSASARTQRTGLSPASPRPPPASGQPGAHGSVGDSEGEGATVTKKGGIFPPCVVAPSLIFSQKFKAPNK